MAEKKTQLPKKAPWPIFISFDSNPNGDLTIEVYDNRKSIHPLYVANIGQGSLNVIAEETKKRGKFTGVYYMMFSYAQVKKYMKTKIMPSSWIKAIKIFAERDRQSREEWNLKMKKDNATH